MHKRLALWALAVLAASPGCGGPEYNTLAPEPVRHAPPPPTRKKAPKKLPPSFAGRMAVQSGVK